MKNNCALQSYNNNLTDWLKAIKTDVPFYSTVKVHQGCLNCCRGTDRWGGGVFNNNLRWWSFRSGLIPLHLYFCESNISHVSAGVSAAAYLGFVLIVTGVVLICAYFMLCFDCLFSCSATHHQAWLTPVTPFWPVFGFVSSAVCQHPQTGLNVHMGIMGHIEAFQMMS